MYTKLIKGILCQNIVAFAQYLSLFICFISSDGEIKALLNVSHILYIVLKHDKHSSRELYLSWSIWATLTKMPPTGRLISNRKLFLPVLETGSQRSRYQKFPSYPMVRTPYGIFPDQGPKLCPPHWQVDSYVFSCFDHVQLFVTLWTV